MAEVFGVDIDRFLSSDLTSLSSLMTGANHQELSTDVVDETEGTLFGALRRKINPSSNLYQYGEFSLSLPLLNPDEQPEIVKPPRLERRAKAVQPTLPPTLPLEEERAPTDESQSVEALDPPTQLLARPYFQFTTPLQFSHGLYSTARLSAFRSCTLAHLIDTSLLALHGVGSDIYQDRLLDSQARVNKPLHVVGYSITATASVVSHFTWLFTLKRLLDAALDALLQSQDPAQLALASAMRDVLYVYSTSLSATRSAYGVSAPERTLSINSPTRSHSTTQPRENLAAISDLWSSTALHRVSLWSLFTLVAPKELFASMASANGSTNAGISCALANGNQIDAFLHKEAWIQTPHRAGWQLLEDIYRKVEQLQRVVWHQHHQFGRPNSLTAFGDQDANGVAESYASLIIASTLLRRVSVPLLAHLQVALFGLYSQSGLSQHSVTEIGSTLPISAEALWRAPLSGEACPIASLLASQYWADGRIALLIGDGLLKTGTAGGGIEYGLGRKTASKATPEIDINATINQCRYLQGNLALPLSSADTATLLRNIEEAEGCNKALRALVCECIDGWIKESWGLDVEVAKGAFEKDEGLRGTKAVSLVTNVPKTAAAHGENHAATSDEPQPDEDAEKTEDENDDSMMTAIEPSESSMLDAPLTPVAHSTTTLTSPVGIGHTVDTELIEAARASLIDKYEIMTQNLTIRQDLTRWRVNRIASLPQSHEGLAIVMEQDRLAWEKEMKKYNEFIHQKMQQEEQGAPADPAKATNTGAGIQDRSSVRVAQAPGGASELSLADGTDATVGAGTQDRPSVRVAQASGGRSAISLRDGSHAIADAEKVFCDHRSDLASTAYTAYHADSARHDDGHQDLPPSVLFSVDFAQLLSPDVSLLDNDEKVWRLLASYWSGLQHLARSNGVDAMDGSDETAEIVNHTPGIAIDQSAATSHVQMGGAERERSNALLRPLSLRMAHTLCRLVKMQCHAVDQAALLSCMNQPHGGLLAHIDSIDDIFLISPRSEFLTTLSTVLVETHLERFPQGVSRLPQELLLAKYRRQAADTRELAVLWTPLSLMVALRKATKRANPRDTCALEYASMHISIQSSQSSADTPTIGGSGLSSLDKAVALHSPSDAIFSVQGLQDLQVTFAAPWPMAVLYTPTVLKKISFCTRRVLELEQMSTLLRLVWCDMHCLRLQARVQEQSKPRAEGPAIGEKGAKGAQKGKKDHGDAISSKDVGSVNASAVLYRLCGSSKAATDLAMRDMHHAYRLASQMYRAIFDFTADRIRSLQLRLRSDIHTHSDAGLSGISWAIGRYANDLPLHIFVAQDAAQGQDQIGAGSSVPGRTLDELSASETLSIEYSICGLLETIRVALRCLSKLSCGSLDSSENCTAAEMKSKGKRILDELHHYTGLIKSFGCLLVKGAKHVENTVEKQNALSLLMFMDN